MPRARLGVALLVPPPLSVEVDGLRRALGDGALGRVPPHVTLVPPVNVAEGRLDEALALVRRAASATAPLTVELGPPGTFLPDNPVVYLGVDGDVGRLHALRQRVLREPFDRTTSWPYVPHVTLADDTAPEVIEGALTALARYRVQVVLERVHVLRQRPDRVWEPVAEAPFRARAVVGRGGLPLELSVTDTPDTEAAMLRGRPFAVTARRDGRVVGTATGAVEGDAARLDALLVERAHRRQGIGSHLLAAVESLAAERGCRSIVATAPAEGPAEAFLRSRGWVHAAADEAVVLRRQLG